MRILFITLGLPHSRSSGARIRDFNVIKQCSRHHSVLLLSLLEFASEKQYLPEIGSYCELVDTVVSRRRSYREQIAAIAKCYITRRPLGFYNFYYQEMSDKIRSLIKTRKVDIVQIEHSFLAPYTGDILNESAPKKILSFHNIGFYQYHSMLNMHAGQKERLLYFLKWIAMLRWESQYCKQYDRCLVVSPLEKSIIEKKSPGIHVSVIENGVDTAALQPLPESGVGNTLLFVGTMGYAPNVDAMLYFTKTIWPLIHQRVANVKLVIVGSHPAREVQKLADMENVTVTGHVPDVIPYYRKARACIVPLRAGGGTRIKILESMALGRPVISTTTGCEGLSVKHRENILIADTPAEFAEGVVLLLQDQILREKISSNARRLVTRRYDWSSISPKLMAVYNDLAVQNT